MEELKNCLRNERILVRFVPKEDSNITNPKHILYGGMAEGAVKYYTVPIIASTGTLKNVLTNDEKAFLESYMGLEYNALSVHNKVNNFWSNYTVRLTKRDNYLDLSDPNDYIKYKVLKNIGTSTKEIGRSINKEVTMFYLIPVMVGLVHSYFAIGALGNIISIDLTKTFVISVIVSVVVFFISAVFSSRMFKKIVRV